MKIFDESVKEEVVKTLTRANIDLEITMEGKDIRVKIGLNKKEHQVEANKQIKQLRDECKRDLR